MKKYMIVGLLVAVSINAFAEEFTSHPEGNEDFVTFIQKWNENWEEDSEIINEGEKGDFLNYITESPEILEIYNRNEKTETFLSIQNPAQYIKPGKCLLNIIGRDILKEIGFTSKKQDCSWRLFCGSEMNYNVSYAVELCGRMVSKELLY